MNVGKVAMETATVYQFKDEASVVYESGLLYWRVGPLV